MYFKKNWGSMAKKDPPLGKLTFFKQALIENIWGVGKEPAYPL